MSEDVERYDGIIDLKQLLESAERNLENEKVRSAALDAALRELLKEYPDGHQQSRWEVTATKWDRARRLLAQASPGDAGVKP